MSKKKIGVVVGSLRRESFSKKVALEVMGMMPDTYEMKLLDISDLPMYNQDLDDDGAPPAQWTALRQTVQGLDGFLFVTPEYNRSVPAVLKNALDVASRPYGSNSWNGKPGAVISVSPGVLSGFGANHALRQSMTFLNVYMMQQPEAYVGNVANLLDENGHINNEGSRKFLQSVADAFAAWVERFA